MREVRVGRNGVRSATEHKEQAALMQWARLNVSTDYRLKWLFAIPNGARVTPAQAGKLKAEGLTAGVADLLLPVPAMHGAEVLHGLFIEMKSSRGVVSNDQLFFAEFVRSQGYAIKLCRSWHEAAKVIVLYLTIAGGTKLRAP